MIISIDGPAGSGKSTVADILAEKLNFIHFNSGALFRGIAAHLLDIGYNIPSITMETKITGINLKVKMIEGIQHVYVNDKDYTPVLRNNEVSINSALVSINKDIREITSSCQKEFCLKNNVVMEGRDIGSNVFPNAEFKFYLDCEVGERARRRFLEEKAKNSKITLKNIEKQLKERDKADRERKIAPLVVPKNAIIVDSTHKTIDEVVQTMLNVIQN